MLEAAPWCLAAGISTTQPWMNVPGIGAAVVLTVDTGVPGAELAGTKAAAELASEIFSCREEFLPTADSVVPCVWLRSGDVW